MTDTKQDDDGLDGRGIDGDGTGSCPIDSHVRSAIFHQAASAWQFARGLLGMPRWQQGLAQRTDQANRMHGIGAPTMAATIKSKFYGDDATHKCSKVNHTCVRRAINS